MTDPTAYTRLPGAGNTSTDGRLAYRHRAYLGPDHVLLVRRSRFSETYRRLYLDDIQSVFYAETDDARMFGLGAIVGAVCAAGLAGVFLQSDIGAAQGGALLCGAVSIILLFLFLTNVVRGASVRCWMRTNGGEVLVPNVGRLRAARRFAQIIENAVVTRQGVADAERLEANLADRHAPIAGESAATAAPPKKRRLPWLMLYAEAAYAALTMAAPEVFPPGVWIFFTVAAWAVILMVVFRDSNLRFNFPYRALMTVTSFYVTARALYWALYWFLLSMEQIIVFEISRQDLLLLGGTTIAVNIVLATLGLIMRAGRPTRPAQPPEPEPITPDADES